MTTTEKFEERNVTFTDKKAIAIEFKTIYKNLRIGRLPDFILIIAFSMFIYYNFKPTLIIILLIAIFTYILLFLKTLYLLKSEFNQKHKLVGTFKVLSKHSSRAGYSFETKYDYIKINKHFYNKINANDIVIVEKFKNGRVFNVIKIIL